MQTAAQPRREAFSKAREHGFSITEFSKSCVDFHWHFHPEFELTWIEKGRGTRSIGHAVQPYADGDLCLIGSGLPHAYGSHPRDRTGAKWTVLHFQPERFGGTFWDLPQNRRIRNLLNEARRGIWFPASTGKIVGALLRKASRARSADFGTIHLLEVLARLAGVRNIQPLNAASASYSEELRDPRLPGLLAWVDEQAEASELSQAAAAQSLHMSPQAFCRYFRRRLGKSFRQYVTELRIARACSKLAHSERAISEIAFEVGFGNLANFNRRFRELLDCTPGEYRRARLPSPYQE